MISILNIAEQCKSILGQGDLQILIQAVKNAIGTYVKTQWYEGKNEGVSEIDGSFIETFRNLIPEKDEDLLQYYINIPSSYVDIPNQMGINQVSFISGEAFVRLGSGQESLFRNLKGNVFGGRQTYVVQGSKMYFPKMKETDITSKGVVQGLLLRLAVGFDGIGDDQQLNIPSSAQDSIVNLVIAKMGQKEKEGIDKELT